MPAKIVQYVTLLLVAVCTCIFTNDAGQVITLIAAPPTDPATK
jgi:hypothetical protein